MTKLDQAKPFGQIWGHQIALFEQDGVMFDGAGNPINEIPEDEPEDEPGKPEDTSPINTFVVTALAGGPVPQAAIYKDAQAAGLNWDMVKTEAAKLGVRIEVVKSKAVWSLK